MAKKKRKTRSENSRRPKADNRTLAVFRNEIFLTRLENRLLVACAYHFCANRNLEELNKKLALYKELAVITNRLPEIIHELSKLTNEPTMFDFRLEGTPLIEALRATSVERISKLQTRYPKVGRPGTPADVATLIYLALERFKGRRNELDRIGQIISPNGPLQVVIDRRFGVGAFRSLNILTPNFREQRWERSHKAPLRKAALRYLSCAKSSGYRSLAKSVMENKLKDLISNGVATEFERRCQSEDEFDHYLSALRKEKRSGEAFRRAIESLD